MKFSLNCYFFSSRTGVEIWTYCIAHMSFDTSTKYFSEKWMKYSNTTGNHCHFYSLRQEIQIFWRRLIFTLTKDSNLHCLLMGYKSLPHHMAENGLTCLYHIGFLWSSAHITCDLIRAHQQPIISWLGKTLFFFKKLGLSNEVPYVYIFSIFYIFILFRYMLYMYMYNIQHFYLFIYLFIF